MAVKDMIMLRQKDLKRLHIIHKAMEGAITQDSLHQDSEERRKR